MSGTQTPEGASRRSSLRSSSRRGSQHSAGSTSNVSQHTNEDEIQVADDNVAASDVESESHVVQADVHEPSNPPTPDPPRRGSSRKSSRNPSEAPSAPSSREPTPEPISKSSKSKKSSSSKPSTTPKSIIKKNKDASSSSHVTSSAPRSKSHRAPVESPKVSLAERFPEFADLQNTSWWPLVELFNSILQSLQHGAHNRTTQEKEDFLNKHVTQKQILSSLKIPLILRAPL